MKAHFFILISVISFCLSSCQLLIHKKCNEQTLSEDLAIMERRMDSTDYQNLKKGLCQIKLEGGDIQDYTYYEVKEFWSHQNRHEIRKHKLQLTDNTIEEAFTFAEELACENWKSRCSQELFNLTKRLWFQEINDRDELIFSFIEQGKTNDAIIAEFALDSFVVSTTPVVSHEELIKSLKGDLNDKIDSLRSL